MVVPEFDFLTAPIADVLVAPGGFGTRPLLHDALALDWIRRTAAEARRVTSVCTGALLLARAGLLTGRHATTHWGALDLLASLDPTVTVERHRRVVDDPRLRYWLSEAISLDVAPGVILVEHNRRTLGFSGQVAANAGSTRMRRRWHPGRQRATVGTIPSPVLPECRIWPTRWSTT